MKKLLLLPLLLFLISCSSEETPSNKIVGTWAFTGVTEVTASGIEKETVAGECAQKTKITFKNNGDFIQMDYYYSYNSLECILNERALNHEMVWEEIADGDYRIFSEGSTGTVHKMIFPGKNTLWMVQSGDAYESNGVSYEYMAHVYKKK
ncbi:hypothetical protein V5739_03725 [Salinimicrobium sp. TIG7-5_MAKvit]|uniref:hypothetical protein n=1 Tax=Salinimicrobium sp. TIG7-5_MAKvit TaxID=3121289 RepID=UPI003C6E32F5